MIQPNNNYNNGSHSDNKLMQKKKVNFLQNLSKHFPTQNGYVIYTGEEPKFPKKKTKKWKKLLANYHCGYHLGLFSF